MEGVIKLHRDGFTLLDNKNLDLSKFKASADYNWKVAQMAKFVLNRVENFVRKGENAGYQHFLLFRHFYHRDFSPSVVSLVGGWPFAKQSCILLSMIFTYMETWAKSKILKTTMSPCFHTLSSFKAEFQNLWTRVKRWIAAFPLFKNIF